MALTDKAINAQVRKEFDSRGKVRTSNLSRNLSTINAARDALLNTTITQEVSDTYLTERYGVAYTSFIPTDPSKKIEEFIKAKDGTGKAYVSMAEKLEIIAAHRNNTQIFDGDDKFSADLAEKQKIKEDAKKRYREAAIEIIKDYQGLVEQSAKDIEMLEKNIITQKENILKEENRIIPGAGETSAMGANGTIQTAKRTEDDVRKDEQQKKDNIKALNKTLNGMETKLDELKRKHNAYVAEFAKRKNDIEAMLAEAKIFKGAEDAGKSEAEESSSGKNNTGLVVTSAQKTPKKLAKSMLEDFFDRSPEEQKTILAQCGSKDILNATRHLGIIERRKIVAVLDARLDELDEELTFTGKHGNMATITKGKLLGKGLTEEDIKAVTEEISEFNKNFKNKSLDEIREFENKIQYIRYACYKQDAGFLRSITRHFGFLKGKEYRMSELSKTLAHYATIKNERDRNQVSQLNKWRKTLKLGPVNDIAITNPRALDRTGQDSIYRQDYYQDEK